MASVRFRLEYSRIFVAFIGPKIKGSDSVALFLLPTFSSDDSVGAELIGRRSPEKSIHSYVTVPETDDQRSDVTRTCKLEVVMLQ